jgi:hypothetical protein
MLRSRHNGDGEPQELLQECLLTISEIMGSEIEDEPDLASKEILKENLRQEFKIEIFSKGWNTGRKRSTTWPL